MSNKRETEVPRTEAPPWKRGSELSFTRQLLSNPPVGEGYIRRITAAEDFRPIISFEANARFPQDTEAQNRILRTYEKTMEQHKNKKKRRSGAEAATHPTRAALAILQNPSFSELHAAIMFFHDLIEDCNVSPKEVQAMAHEIGYTQDAKRIAQAVSALSRVDDKGNKIEDEALYMEGLAIIHQDDPELRIVELKSTDTIDNTKDDTFMLVVRPEEANREKIKKYNVGEDGVTGKIEKVIALATATVPDAKTTHDLIALREYNMQLTDQPTVVWKGAA